MGDATGPARRYGAAVRDRLGRAWAAAQRHPGAVDAAVAGVLGLLGLLGVWAYEGFLEVPLAVAVALTAALAAPLAWRRRFPLSVLGLTTAVFVPYRLLQIPEATASSVVLFLALYSAGACGAARWRTQVRALATTALTLLIAYSLFVAELDDAAAEAEIEVRLVVFQAFVLLLNAFFFAAAWVFGDGMRERREREVELREHAAQLEAERAENARRAVLDERVRIARELHDVVAHHVSVMGVQAGAARRVLSARPERAEEALSSIEASSRQAVGELHRLLGFLRQEGDADELAPLPTMRQLGELTAQTREVAGLPVRLSVEGEERPLPPSVDLSAYRIVQEALTNAVKHAGPATATVTVRYGPSALDVEVADDGRGPGFAAPANGGTGHGLVGMRERVALHGGRLTTGRRPGGGFVVRARFPLDGGGAG